MLAFLAASLLALSSSASAPAAASASPAAPAPQAAAPAPAAGQPLRQVVYNVSQGSRTYSGGEHYEGYSSNSTSTADRGTVNVAVLSVVNNVLQVSVTETMINIGRPATYDGSVLPDGAVNFPPETITDVTRQILEYFASDIEPKDKTVLGSTWDVGLNRNGVDLATHYKVTKVDGDLVTLAVNQTVKIAAQNVTVALDGTIVMKPSLLVPVSGDLHRTLRRLTTTGDTTTVSSYIFQRVSDTLDSAAH
jgi:opacity protein-like surface antigen